ncbi:MAG: GldG family protein [Treponema sp.]|nr:GldG family protein [Treponema sp.]
MTKKQTTIITVLTIIAIILGILVSGRFWFRFDLTKNKAYTISRISRDLHKELLEPVNITYYISDKLKTAEYNFREIEDTLREYVAYSRGKIHLFIKDPVKSELTMMVEGYGIQPRQLPILERDQASLITVYSGIVIEYLDRVEVLYWVDSINTLEYSLTTRINSMIMNTERWIGVIVGDEYRQWNEDFGYLNMLLFEAGYRVRLISPGDEIPDNIPGLFVLGGVEDLDEWALYRIDRYIQLGGNVFFAVKGVFVDTIYSSLEAREQINLGLLDMIASYGVAIRQVLVLDRNALVMQFPSRTPEGSMLRRVNYPLWIGVTGDSGNKDHPVSAGFAGLDLYWASPLELVYTPSVESKPLFSSSAQAWLMRNAFYTNPGIPHFLEIEAPDTMGVKTLGASLTGVFPSFFRGNEKPFRDFSTEELPDIPEQGKPSRIIVVGDVDFATNLIVHTQEILSFSQPGPNLDFLLRVADYITNDDYAIKLRNRQPQTGRFDKITSSERKTSAENFSKIINVGIIPFLVIITGLILAILRRRRSERDDQTTASVVKENSDDL